MPKLPSVSIAQRLTVAVDGLSLLSQDRRRYDFWMRVAEAVAGLVKEVEQRADERLAARAEVRAAELAGSTGAELEEAIAAAKTLDTRLDALLENWRVVIAHDHPTGKLSCAVCAGYKGAIRDLEKARQPL